MKTSTSLLFNVNTFRRSMPDVRKAMSHPIEQLEQIMRRLRDPEQGCPWDKEQTFDTIAPYTIEETFEVVDAITQRDWPNLREELGICCFR